jgi:hypothetical protein
VPGRDEVPPALALAEVQVRGQDRAAAVEAALRVLDVYVVDPIRELGHECGRVEELRGEVARVEVDAEALAPVDRLERAPGGDEVVGDLGGVDLEPEADALRVEDVDDRAPALRELLVAAVDLGEVVRRERVELVPDRRTGEAVHLGDPERGRGARRFLHPLGRALPHPLAFAVAPDLRRNDRAVALVDRVAHRLADEVRADRPALEPVLLEQLALLAEVVGLSQRPVDLEVVAPAGELQPVESEGRGLAGQVLKRQVGPLAREERDWPRHAAILRRVGE